MTIFGWSLERVRKSQGNDLITRLPAAVSTSSGWVGLFGRLGDFMTGSWQRGLRMATPDIMLHSTVWACVTLIASDIGKLAVRLIAADEDGIWSETLNSAYSPVLRKPNRYQNRIKFFEYWILSKLRTGNTYVLKVRDGRGGEGMGNVKEMHILDPSRVQVLVAPDGAVYYDLATDVLAGLPASVQVPASEIIHDVGVALYHPLVGLPPLVAAALAATTGLRIQETSTRLFTNNSNPGGVLTAPNKISQDTADRIQKHWDENFAGPDNIGKVAVLGDGLKFEKMTMTSVDAQLAEQLDWTDLKICSVHHVPPYMVGVGQMPTYDNIEALNQQYYSQCLQNLIECIELCLDEGLGLATNAKIGVEFDLTGLLRMDSERQMKNATEGVKGGVLAPNEARRAFNLKKVAGGDSPYLQHQNYSLEALAKRDAKDDPFEKPTDSPPPKSPKAEAEPDDADAGKAFTKRFQERLAA